MMQDPFDLLGIQMLLYDVRPAIILETGTANGGSALLWASILEVLGLEDTRWVCRGAGWGGGRALGRGPRQLAGAAAAAHRLQARPCMLRCRESSTPRLPRAA